MPIAIDFAIIAAVHSVTSLNSNVRDFDCLPNHHWTETMAVSAVIQNLCMSVCVLPK